MSRNRLTEQAIANIKAADKAKLEKIPGSGYKVTLVKDKSSIELTDKTQQRPVIFSSKDNAKRSLIRHNENIDISLKPQI
ncbi:hypothetical protein [Methylovulum miyakonense]|uniref:hypothetical protein n=1 Tax=Methylovulum miyakonense TaxID=645578 RepID=UPI00037F88B2|nr:hypothetical protein [Methylovulum miyakonense]